MDKTTLNEIIGDFAGKIRENDAEQLAALASEQTRLECIITAQKREILTLVTTFSEKTADSEVELSELKNELASKAKELEDVAHAQIGHKRKLDEQTKARTDAEEEISTSIMIRLLNACTR